MCFNSNTLRVSKKLFTTTLTALFVSTAMLRQRSAPHLGLFSYRLFRYTYIFHKPIDSFLQSEDWQVFQLGSYCCYVCD